MSEYQRIAFRAIDGPVSEKNLEYMRRQSTRAEITAWSFDNEYHYGDFRGDALEMLRRGYDLFVRYANFGIRSLFIRLPHGLPDFETADAYFDEYSLKFEKDKRGPGGILTVEPFFEAGELEEIWEIDDLIGRLIGLRAEILDGDLRPLYLMHLAVASDGNHFPEETSEAPVPAGLDMLSDAQRALAEFYGLSDSLIMAAWEGCAQRPASIDPEAQFAEWLHGQPEASKDRWLAQWMADPRTDARREVLAQFRKNVQLPSWPIERRNRTMAELLSRAEEIRGETNRKAAENAARQRAKKLAKMAADPSQTLRETEKLVAERSVSSYQQAAELLAGLRDALAGSQQANLAEKQAQKLKSENPNRRMLTAELRRQGFLPNGSQVSNPDATSTDVRAIRKGIR